MNTSETIFNAANYGKAIRKRRKELGYTQMEVCEISGLSVSFLSDLENGKKTIELEKALLVASLLGLDVELKCRG